MSDSFNILTSSAGRRVALVHDVLDALRGLGLRGPLFAAGLNRALSACHAAGRAFPAPLVKAGRFIDQMLALYKRERIKLVVPTIDPELSLYADHRERFAEIGTTAAVSSPQAIPIGANRRETHRRLSGKGLPVTRRATINQVLDKPRSRTPRLRVQPDPWCDRPMMPCCDGAIFVGQSQDPAP